jgi:poly(3-hydroxybutyrate) depolymerase
MPNPALTPSIRQTVLAGLSRTLARGEEHDQQTAAALLEAFQPGTPIQAMLAAQAVALHHAAIDCFGRAMQTPEEDGAAITRLQRNGASLTRAFAATLHALQRCQAAAAQAAETERQKPLQREDATSPCLQPAPDAPSLHQDGWEHPLQREKGSDLSAAPPGNRGEVLGPRFREDDGGSHPSGAFAQNPLQREPLPRQADLAEQQPIRRRWEDLSEAEQFAILYPERVAAGATSHEDIDLWLTKPAKPAAPVRSAR